MKKELSPIHDLVSCEICERTILKGERTEAYLSTDGSRRLVCELCLRRAERAGWIRESAHADLPAATPHSEPRPSLVDRFRRWRTETAANRAAAEGDVPEAEPGYAKSPEYAEPRYEGPAPYAGAAPERAQPRPEAGHPAEAEADAAPDAEVAAGYDQERQSAGYAGASHAESYEQTSQAEAYDADGDEYPAEPAPLARPREPGGGPRDPRHVRAVPTNSQAKVERALEVFNASEYRRTVAGLVRTLGEPWVTAVPVLESPSEVTVVVAWELSWYHYRVDLADAGEPVHLFDKGAEVDEIDDELREWNASAGPDGTLTAGVASGQ